MADPSVEGATIESDEERLKQVLINLVSNALKFCSKGFIWLTLSSEGDELLGEVADSGIGIWEEDQKLLFRMFGKLSATQDKIRRDVGLG